MRLLALGFCVWLLAASAAVAQDAPTRLNELHGALNLTAQQESSWRRYSAAVVSDPQAQARRRAAEQLLPQLTTPRRIALLDAAMNEDLAGFRREGDAIDAFYGQLTPDQQRIFDRETLSTQSRQSAY